MLAFSKKRIRRRAGRNSRAEEKVPSDLSFALGSDLRLREEVFTANKA